MRLLISIQIILFILFSAPAGSQGIEFFEKSWDEALEKAIKDKKTVFVHAYTKWCGPCRRMLNTVYPEREAGDFYNKNFINFKIDMETQSGIEFGSKYPVRAFPTLYFINPKGEVVYQHVGSADVQRLIDLGKKALSVFTDAEELEAEWDEGNRDYDFVLSYVKSLVLKSMPANRTVYEYLHSNPDLSDEQKAVLIYEATTESDSRLFDMMTERRNMRVLSRIYSEKEISDKLFDVCWRTVIKSYDFDVPSLKDDAKNQMKKLNKKRYSEFNSRIALFDAEHSGDIENYKAAARKYFDQLKDSQSRIRFIDDISTNVWINRQISELKEDLASSAFKKEKTPTTYLAYIRSLFDNKKYSEVMEHLPAAIKMATDAQDNTTLSALQRFEMVLRRRMLE
jgi:thiol-disulfide isomerase/thioredoxin